MQALAQQFSNLCPSSASQAVHDAAYSSSRSSSRSALCATPPPQGVCISWRRSVGSKSVDSISRCLPSNQHLAARPRNVIRGSSGESGTTSTVQAPSSPVGGVDGVEQRDSRVKHITSIEQFDEELRNARNKLVVVEFAATHSANSRLIYPSMVDLSKTLKGVVFLLVLGDESEALTELCEREKIEKVPHFVFYKHSARIHEEEGITSDKLEGDVLFYGDNDAPIHMVRSKADFEILLKEHASDNKLVVLDVGLKSCGPCVKIYPTFVTLSKRMVGNTVFARMHGDENEECAALLKSIDVVEVPTFLFIRDGKPLGRYVGSGRGELVGEILRYNGVRVT